MDVKNLADELKNRAGEVENLMRRKLPVIVVLNASLSVPFTAFTL